MSNSPQLRDMQPRIGGGAAQGIRLADNLTLAIVGVYHTRSDAPRIATQHRIVAMAVASENGRDHMCM